MANVNRAIVFIKPHALNQSIEDFVQSHFTKHKIKVKQTEIVPGDEIEAKGLIDRHYGLIAERAVGKDPKSWLASVPKAKLAVFKSKYGYDLEKDEKALLMNLKVYMTKYPKATAAGIQQQWEANGSLKLVSGTYVGQLDSGEYVINAFYGSMRAKFTDPSVKLVVYSVEFDEKELSWDEFREQVIGATNPMEAAGGSLRSEILKKYAALGLKHEPSVQDNGVHASAGPIEALQERCIWLGVELKNDEMTQLLVKAGVSIQTIQSICNNGEIQLTKSGGKAYDLFEDKNTSEVVNMLKGISA